MWDGCKIAVAWEEQPRLQDSHPNESLDPRKKRFKKGKAKEKSKEDAEDKAEQKKAAAQ